MSATIDFGIDLGTTNSSIALCRDGEVRIFQTTELMNVTPSVVYVSRTGRMLVGRKAWDAWVQDPQNTQAEFKRWMGYSDTLTFPSLGKNLSAEELSAEVLKSLRADVVRHGLPAISAAVITVPAAFGNLQCEATGRAARLAGLTESPLLQEPIAAAIAYGANPASRDQRWMVFDLGGGTLDIAVVSTRNGQLAVLEHQGNNRLGGKDIDRLIAEQVLLPALSQTFRLPETSAPGYDRLMRILLRHAEQTKIALSTADTAPVDLFDLGDDAEGKPMELSLTVTRADLESRIAPVVEQCLDLARRALSGARMTGADLSRVLLVGGPTQMPIIRAALQAELKTALDHSLDPMTVVARGAALYASTVESVSSIPAAASTAAGPVSTSAGESPSIAQLQLAYERASGTLQSPVGGVITPANAASEIKIDAVGGFWTSGWMPLADGGFAAEVMLQAGKPVTAYTISARNRTGDAISLDPCRFSIAYMLPMAAPPLPHAIAVELSAAHGVSQWDRLFERHTPLPAEVRKTYRAERMLRPSEVGSSLPIKFWEIDVSDDPQERWWAGCVHLRASHLTRPVPEGAELELQVKIDTSRKLSVELFIPLLNVTLTEDVYVPDPPTARSRLRQELDLLFERIEYARSEIYVEDSSRAVEISEDDLQSIASRLTVIQEQAEEVAESFYSNETGNTDPDAAVAPTETLRRLRVQLAQIEERLGIGSAGMHLVRRTRASMRWTAQVIPAYATPGQMQDFERLSAQFQKYVAAHDLRGVEWAYNQVHQLRWTILRDQIEFWREKLEVVRQPYISYTNKAEAQKAIQEAIRASEANNVHALRSAVQRCFDLMPNDAVENYMEQSARSGLRGS